MADKVTFSPAEFSQLDLDGIIYAPLAATIKAHVDAANTTLSFVQKLANAKNMKFTTETTNGDGIPAADGAPATPATITKKEISVPLLAMVKTPNLNFDSLSIDFEYKISQVYTKTTNWNADLNVDLGGPIATVLKVGLKGSVGAKGSTSNTINKSGSLGIKVHASESELPLGLEKVINWLTDSVETKEVPE